MGRGIRASTQADAPREGGPLGSPRGGRVSRACLGRRALVGGGGGFSVLAGRGSGPWLQGVRLKYP